MTDTPDAELLEQFAREGSESAFAALVERYVALVHSVALRHVANPRDSQDITQAVFIVLARKAGTLGRKTVLPGWLYRTAQLTAANFQRSESRRIRREQEAFMQSTLEEPATDALWRELSPKLDEAMASLGAGERDALVLRYFQNKSVAEVGTFLGVEENTAQKRVGRALEKLRKFFGRRGVISTTAIIAGAISANSVQAAPAGLAQTISAVAVAKGAAASTSTLTLVKGALKIMAWTKAQTAAVTGAVVLIAAAGTTTVAVKAIREHENEAWRQLGPGGSSNYLLERPFRTVILPTEAADFKGGQGATSGSTQMPDGRCYGVNQSIEDMMRSAFTQNKLSRVRTILDTELATNRYDYFSNPPKGAAEALQDKIRTELGLTGELQMIDTNAMLLEVKYPNSPGLKPSHSRTGSSSSGNGEIRTKNGTIDALAMYVEEMLGVPVINQTGLTNGYDYTISWHSDGGDRPNVDQLEQALVQQVGLELVPTNSSVQMLVVGKVN